MTTAVLLDARSHVGKGRAMADGELVTAAHIEGMLKAQGLAKRGILPGDMVWIYTGWSEHWKDGDEGGPYYAMAPGLSVDAAKLLAGKRIVAIGLDAPFIDAVPSGMLQGKAPPAPGTEPGLPFSVHHYMLSVFGIHHLENLNLAGDGRRPCLDLVRDGAALARQGRGGRGDPAGRDRPARPALKGDANVRRPCRHRSRGADLSRRPL